MKAPVQKPERRGKTLLRFLVVGGANTALDVTAFLVMVSLGIPPLAANMLSTSAGLTLSFFANRYFTFAETSAGKPRVLLFLLVTLSGLWVLQPAVILVVAPLMTPLWETPVAMALAKVLATAVSMCWNYLGYTFLVFPKILRSSMKSVAGFSS